MRTALRGKIRGSVAERASRARGCRRRAAGSGSIRGAVVCAALAAIVLAATAHGEASLLDRLAAASPDRGQKVFRVCSACHAIDAGAAHAVGPNLRAVIGRPVAAAEGFDRYSPAMKSYGGTWTLERLDRYLRQPAVEAEGTTMLFPGIPDAGDRADLIAWLNLNSPSPADFASNRAAPEAAGDVTGTTDSEAEMAAATPPPARPPNLGVLVAGEGAEETHAYCTPCHSERIVAQQGLTRVDWEELLEQMVEENGMNPIEEPDLGRVLSYLATHYGPDRPNFPNR